MVAFSIPLAYVVWSLESPRPPDDVTALYIGTEAIRVRRERADRRAAVHTVWHPGIAETAGEARSREDSLVPV